MGASAAPRTVAGVLFGDDAPAELSRSAGWAAVTAGLGAALGTVSAQGRRAAMRELPAAVAALGRPSLVDLLLAGWRGHRALRAAAYFTQEHPDATEVVALATHEITSEHRPYVEIVVDGVRVATLHFDLSVTFEVEAALATVRRAKLVAVEGGRCAVGVALGFEGRELVSRRADLDLPLAVDLGGGVALLPARRDRS
jgi:hypothetical protein